MTDKEHALMMMMFTRQDMYIQILFDILKREEIIQGDDISAFEAVARNDPKGSAVFDRVDEQYRMFAKVLGLELPTLPPSLASTDQQL